MAGNKINKIKFSPVDIEERKKLDFRAGDTVSVSSKILDEKGPAKGGAGKYRLQAFEGIVLGRKHGTEAGATFTVRKIGSGGIGVERIFPVTSPWISKLEVKKKGDVHRSKLYYIRDQSSHQVGKIHVTSS